MQTQPWASGPGEILQHGLSLLKIDSDKNRRLALLSIDNAVELTIKTYLNLPKRITGLEISRKHYAEISESFPALLDAMEQYATSKLSGIDLGDLEWYHRLRNELYHQGNGLTVERNKVEIYAELAKLLYKNLFGLEIDTSENESSTQELIGKFLSIWVNVERNAWIALEKVSIKNEEKRQPSRNVFSELVSIGIFDQKTVIEIEALRQLRNGVVHGDPESIRVLSLADIERAMNILTLLKNIVANK